MRAHGERRAGHLGAGRLTQHGAARPWSHASWSRARAGLHLSPSARGVTAHGGAPPRTCVLPEGLARHTAHPMVSRLLREATFHPHATTGVAVEQTCPIHSTLHTCTCVAP
eukprot:4300405-Prymnesium_polylepis.3